MSITAEQLEKTADVPGRCQEPPAPPEAQAQPEAEELVVEDLLVEDVSIDGMCGVY